MSRKKRTELCEVSPEKTTKTEPAGGGDPSGLKGRGGKVGKVSKGGEEIPAPVCQSQGEGSGRWRRDNEMKKGT